MLAKGKLSVIMPYVREYPQNIFTLMNIYEELRGRCDFEILAVNNFVPGQVKADGKTRDDDAGQDAMNAAAKCHPGNIISLKYDKKLSHWNAKNHAVQHASGEFLWFVDAHCIVARDALFRMFSFFKAHHEELNGSIHLPLTYKIHERKKLIYKPVINAEKGEVAYTFCSCPDAGILSATEKDFLREDPISWIPAAWAHNVPCMSMCGAMMTRNQYDDFGGWPEELGIYSGGEHFFNYVSAILGYKKWIMMGGPLRHYGAPRGYSWNFADFHRNRLIANYMFGGREWMYRYAKRAKPHAADTKLFCNLAEKIENTSSCIAHREMIESKQIMSIEEWIEKLE